MKKTLLALVAFVVCAQMSFADNADFYSQFEETSTSSKGVKSAEMKDLNGSLVLGDFSPEAKRRASNSDLVTSYSDIDVGYDSDDDEDSNRRAVQKREALQKKLEQSLKPSFWESAWETMKSVATKAISTFKNFF